MFLFCLWNEFTVSIMCLRLSIVYFSAYKTELELKLLENLAQILGKYAVIDKIVSPQSAIDDCKLAHFFFTNSLSARVYKFNACKLHNSLFASFPVRKLHERYRIALQYVAQFHVLPRDLSFVLTNFLCLNPTSRKNRPLFKRIFAQYAMKFHANFRANFCRKITGTKNEICTFRFHYFCTTLYIYYMSYGIIGNSKLISTFYSTSQDDLVAITHSETQPKYSQHD